MPDTVQDLIRQEATKAGVPIPLALAVAEQESGFNPTVVGPKLDSGEQAIGTFQVLPSTAKARGFDPYDPRENIRGGVGYLRELLDQNKGDLTSVLKTYGGVVKDESYVPSVLGRLGKFKDTSAPAPAAKPTFTDESVPISAQQKSRERIAAAKARPQPLAEAAAGALHGAVNTVQGLASPIRKAFGMEPANPYPEETSTAGKIGRFAEQGAEFAVPAGVVSKGAEAAGLAEKLAAKGFPALAAKFGAAAAEGVGQGAAAYGVSKAQGASDSGANVNAALSTVAPIASKALELGAPAIRAAAVTKLAKVFAKGVENAGPEIQYGLKTGDMAPDVKDAADIVRQAASDTINLPLQGSWGKWMTTNGKNVAASGKNLGTAIKSDLGNEMLFKQPLIDTLDKLETESAKHFAEINGGNIEKVYNEPLFKQIKILKDALNASGEDKTGYGPMISVRNLSDLKQTWDNAVYGLSTVGKVGISPEVLTATAQKEATKKVADSVRALFTEKAPQIAQLNQIASHAYRLEDLTKKLYKVSPGLGKTASTILHVAGAGTGAAVAEAMGGHTLYGIMAGGALARSLEAAFNSPLWQTARPVLKGKIANALIAGDADTVRKLIAPFVSATVSQETQTAAAR